MLWPVPPTLRGTRPAFNICAWKPDQVALLTCPCIPSWHGLVSTTGISHLSDCKQLSENDVKRLCDKVRRGPKRRFRKQPHSGLTRRFPVRRLGKS